MARTLVQVLPAPGAEASTVGSTKGLYRDRRAQVVPDGLPKVNLPGPVRIGVEILGLQLKPFLSDWQDLGLKGDRENHLERKPKLPKAAATFYNEGRLKLSSAEDLRAKSLKMTIPPHGGDPRKVPRIELKT